MFNKKEILIILGLTVVIAISLSFLHGLDFFWVALASVFAVLVINVLAKKIMAFYLESEIEIDFWKIKRFGFKPHQEFKRAFPAGVLFPLLSSILTLGNFTWLGTLVFDVKPKVYRAARRHNLYKFSEITEDHIGFIAAAGVAANLVFALIGYLIGFSEFARINVYFAFFNIIPLSSLDGNKIFFGNIALWSLLATITLLGAGFALFLI